MLRWTLIFLVVAIVAAVFGFGGVAAASAGIARILFFHLFDPLCGLPAGWPYPKSVKMSRSVRPDRASR